MNLKLLLFGVALLSLSFAAPWESTAIITVVIAAALLGVIYMAGIGFDSTEIQTLAKEELFQLLALILMLALFVGSNNFIDSFSKISDLTDNAPTMQKNALEILSVSLSDVRGVHNDVYRLDKEVSLEGSKVSQCNLMGIGYSVSACGGYSVIVPAFSMSGNIISIAISELSSMQRLIAVSNAYALVLLLPFGIILRTFKVTRGAGGFLIAVAISMHLLLPLGIVFNDILWDTFLADPLADEYTNVPDVVVLECNPADTGPSPLGLKIATFGLAGLNDLDDSNDGNTIGTYYQLRSKLKEYLAIMLLKATLGPVLALLMFALGVKTISTIAGAEVDVTAISRFI